MVEQRVQRLALHKRARALVDPEGVRLQGAMPEMMVSADLWWQPSQSGHSKVP